MRHGKDNRPLSERGRPVRRWHLVTIVVIGLGLAAAPAMFQMFTRAPGGGDMLVDFAPYMTREKIDSFRRELTEIGAARDDAVAALAALPAEQQSSYQSVQTFNEQWPAIDEDMRSMLTTMERNIGNYRGVKALPPFWLFPWCFVLPGLMIAAGATWILVSDRGSRPSRRRRIAVLCLGIGLIAAPAVFQMFTRAPGGAQMIRGFEPFMTPSKVTKVQGYFLTIGAGEGQLRRAVIADYAAATGSSPDAVLPAVRALSRDWPAISADMAPMVGTMADNVDNFAGIAALPPFWLFPWFFVLPGVMVVALARAASKTIVAGTPKVDVASERVRGSGHARVLRVVAATAVVLELALLAGMNLVLDRSKTTTTTKRASGAAAPAGRLGSSDTAAVIPPPATTVGAGGDSAVVTAAVPTTTPSTAPTTAPAGPPPPSTTQLSCPLGLPPAPSGGGVASLTPILPAFGPYSAEAFAMLPAFQPLFPLFGPLLVAGQPQLERMDPVLAVLLPLLQQLENGGFTFLSPVYTPYRQQMLDAEQAFAQQVAQLTAAIAAAPGAGCLPALEAMLTPASG